MPRSTTLRRPVEARSSALHADAEESPQARSANPRRGAPARAGPLSASLLAVGYLRRSTDRQEQSIPDQKRAVEHFAAERGYRIVRFYTDDAISGTSTVGRRAFQQLIADAKNSGRDFSTIIVYDVKRFGRVDNDEAGYYRHTLRMHGVEVLYASENFSGDGTDDLLRPVKQWQAREESKDLAKVVIRGLLSKTEARGWSISGSGGGGAERVGGWWMGGAPPFGFDLRYESQSGEGLFIVRMMPDGSKQLLQPNGSGVLVRTLQRGETLAVSKRDRARLVPSEAARVKIVRQIFRMYVEQNRGFKAIADHLNRAGTPTPRGPEWSQRYCGKWAMTTVRAMLVNPAYAGDLVWNRRTDARFSRISQGRAVERKGIIGRRLEPNPESDWITTRDAHEPIVTRRVFELAQQIMREKPESLALQGINPRTGQPAGEGPSGPPGAPGPSADSGGRAQWTGPRSKFLLSGLLSCSACGCRYEGYSRYPRPARDHDPEAPRTRQLFYACGGYIRHGRSVCELGAIPLDLMESAVIEAVLSHYAPLAGAGGLQKIERLLRAQVDDEHVESAKSATKQRKRIEQIDAAIRNLLDHLTERNREIADRRVAELAEERERIERRLDSNTRASLASGRIGSIAEEAHEAVRALGAILRSGSMEERAATIRRCVERGVVEFPKRRVKVFVRALPDSAEGPIEMRVEAVEAAIAAGTP